MSEKVCRDCPLYSARKLWNSSRFIQVSDTSGERVRSTQEHYALSVAEANQFGNFPMVKILIPEGMGTEQVNEAVDACNAATHEMSGKEKLSYIGRVVINKARPDCPAFNELQVQAQAQPEVS